MTFTPLEIGLAVFACAEFALFFWVINRHADRFVCIRPGRWHREQWERGSFDEVELVAMELGRRCEFGEGDWSDEYMLKITPRVRQWASDQRKVAIRSEARQSPEGDN